MTMIAAADVAAGIGKFLLPFAGSIALIAGGFAGAELWEHRSAGPSFTLPLIGKVSPFGTSLKAQLVAARAAVPSEIATGQTAGVKQQAASDAPAFAKFQAALAQCQAAAAATRNTSAAAITKTDTFTSTQAAQAYQLGRSTCEATNATKPPVSSPGAIPSGVRVGSGPDFADLFNPAAYAPSGQAAVPGGSDGAANSRAAAPGGD